MINSKDTLLFCIIKIHKLKFMIPHIYLSLNSIEYVILYSTNYGSQDINPSPCWQYWVYDVPFCRFKTNWFINLNKYCFPDAHNWWNSRGKVFRFSLRPILLYIYFQERQEKNQFMWKKNEEMKYDLYFRVSGFIYIFLRRKFKIRISIMFITMMWWPRENHTFWFKMYWSIGSMS